MRIIELARLRSLLTLGLIIFAECTLASQWKPLCIEGSSCNSLRHGNSFYSVSIGPLVTHDGIVLQHKPYEIDFSNFPYHGPDPHIMMLSESGLEDFGGGFGEVNDVSANQLPSGTTMSFDRGDGIAWDTLDGEKTPFDWYEGGNSIHLNLAEVKGPPVVIDNDIYIGLLLPGGTQLIYASYDNGVTWVEYESTVRIGLNSHLSVNPEENALWAIQSNHSGTATGLFESQDHGVNWQRIDDDSIPASTMRIIHDPANLLTSYALANDGLFVSYNRGVSWQATTLTDPVHGLAFAARNVPLTRALIVGTDTGVKVSVDETQTWLDMSDGLLEIPHTVTYAHDTLIATSSAGYFTCNRIDCAGLSQPTIPVEDDGLVEVVEFYNVNLEHYFMTSSESEIKLIADGLAGAGWERTGESFLAWELGSNAAASNVCRFYGSMNPGPNSHFYSLSMHDCRSLMDLQESQPSTQPRWNFEQWAFSVIPPVKDMDKPCAENLIPVYRAYNNGYSRGEDSNHRYVTYPALLTPLIADGWTEEGVVFCSPQKD